MDEWASCACKKSRWNVPSPGKLKIDIPVECEHCGRLWTIRRYPGGLAEIRIRRRDEQRQEDKGRGAVSWR